MAGTQFKKLKSGQVHAMIRHDCREHEDYTNTDIDKSKSHLNVTIGFKGYRDADGMRRRLKERMTEVEKTNTNHRKDRVEAFSLLFYVPEGMSYKESVEWMQECMKILCHKYGGQNFIGGVGHFDEVHEYVDPETKRTRISRPHITGIMIPEHDGQLNGKWFSSRQNIRDVNEQVQAMTKMKFPGYTYMTGTGRKSRKSVEELKNESDFAEWEMKAENMKIEAQKWTSEANRAKSEVTGLKSDKNALEGEIEALKGEYDTLSDSVSKLTSELEGLTGKIRQRRNELTTQQKQDLEIKRKEMESKIQMLNEVNGVEIEL